jgi:hypothetical protein
MQPRRRERGALLGIVMIMLMVLMAASIFAFFTLRTDSGAAAQDRLAHQLFDCAEQGLQIGKATFAPAIGQWPSYFGANAPGTALSNGITLPAATFPQAASPIVPVAGYPLQQTVTMALGLPGSNQTMTFNRAIAIYNNPADTGLTSSDTDLQAIVWSACMEPSSKQVRATQALMSAIAQKNGNYFGQAGFGYNNSGNTNNTPR